ncbi:putative inorganic phosphate cotransporter isoform X2 [Atheta coriaria]|uniref:putative inorganic phosphate cotransporter isoform X2 n=1 Tax=Dalotia coriaria TaxID=877792 RepID=UPI0031F3898E
MGFGKGTKEEAESTTDINYLQPKRWFGTRHMVTLMLFMGMANAYIMRTNMSVAIVAMVNHTAVDEKNKNHVVEVYDDECGVPYENEKHKNGTDGEYVWDNDIQSYILSSFFYGYVITQIPFGILAKRYGNIWFLGVGMLVNSVFGLLVPIAAEGGIWTLIIVRFIQGLGEGPIVPCTHALLAKWIPPNERSRMGAFVYAGAQFGTVISMPLSGLLSQSDAGWPSIFYAFGAVGTIWSLAFLWWVYEDPEVHPTINPDEKKYIMNALWGTQGITMPPIPWKSIIKSMPFWAILIAHMGHNYGYETLMTELPTYMKQVLRYDIKENGTLSALPYLAMWIFSMFASQIADKLLSAKILSLTVVRKILNGIGQFGPAIALVGASFTGCQRGWTVAILTVGVGLNGGIYSGFKVNHLDISPRFAGILMAFTNCLANLAGLLAPLFAGQILKGGTEVLSTHEKWQIVFVTAGGVYAVCCTIYLIFGSGERQPWDNPGDDEDTSSSRSTSCRPQNSKDRDVESANQLTTAT